MPPMPGMPGAGGGRAQKRQQRKPANKRGHKVSGNPARRSGGPAAPAAATPPPAVFGQQVPSDADLAKAVGEFQLPPELQQLFNPKNTGPR